MKIYIYTQVLENYGDAEAPHWKPKGGDDYFLPLEGDQVAAGNEYLQTVVDSAKSMIEVSNSFMQEFIIGWDLVEDDFMSEYEKDQLEYRGYIHFPAKILRRNEDFEWEFGLHAPGRNGGISYEFPEKK